MGTASYVLVGTADGERLSFSSSCHGAGRAMSRHKAVQIWKGREVIDELTARGIIVQSPSSRGVAEEAPGAYKDVGAVVDAADAAGLSRKVAKLVPLDRLLIETDSPFLAPVPHRGERNEPARVVHVAEMIATVRGMTAEAVGAAALDNFRRVFNP